MDENVGLGQDDSGEEIFGTAYVREAGCEVVYRLNLENPDEEQFLVEMDREQAERLYEVLGKMLGKNEPTRPIGPFTPTAPLPPPQPYRIRPPWYPANPFWPNGTFI